MLKRLLIKENHTTTPSPGLTFWSLGIQKLTGKTEKKKKKKAKMKVRGTSGLRSLIIRSRPKYISTLSYVRKYAGGGGGNGLLHRYQGDIRAKDGYVDYRGADDVSPWPHAVNPHPIVDKFSKNVDYVQPEAEEAEPVIDFDEIDYVSKYPAIPVPPGQGPYLRFGWHLGPPWYLLVICFTFVWWRVFQEYPHHIHVSKRKLIIYHKSHSLFYKYILYISYN